MKLSFELRRFFRFAPSSVILLLAAPILAVPALGSSGTYSDTNGNKYAYCYINETVTRPNMQSLSAEVENTAVGLFLQGTSYNSTIVNPTITASSSSGQAIGIVLSSTYSDTDGDGVYDSVVGSSVSGGISSTFISASSDGEGVNVFGVYVDGYSSIAGEISSTISTTVTDSTSVAMGLYAYDASTVTASFTGSINLTVNSSSAAYGYGTDSSYTAQSDSSYGLYNNATFNSSGFDVDWSVVNFTVTNNGGSAYAVYLSDTDGFIDSIGGNLTASSTASGAYALYLNGCDVTGDITGALTASGYYSAYGMFACNYVELGSVDGSNVISSNITASSSKISAFGLYLNNGTTVYSDFTGNIEVNAYSSAYGIYLAGSLEADGYDDLSTYFYGDIGTDDSVINVTSSNSVAYGIMLSSYSNLSGDIAGTVNVTGNTTTYGICVSGSTSSFGDDDSSISADITVTSNSGKAYGIQGRYTTFTSDFTGTLEVTGATGARGIDLYGYTSTSCSYDADIAGEFISATTSSGDAIGISLSYTSVTGEICTELITASSSTGSATGVSISNSEVGDILSDIIATGQTAMGISVSGDSSVGVISGNITAVTTSEDASNATAILVSGTTSITLAQGMTISASSSVTGELGTAISSDGDVSFSSVDIGSDAVAVVYTLLTTASEDSDDVIIEGNIELDGALSFTEGSYTITSDYWTVTEVDFYDGVAVTINSDIIVNNASDVDSYVAFNFYVTDVDSLDEALLYVAEGTIIDGVDAVNVYLSDEVASVLLSDGSSSDLLLIDGDFVSSSEGYAVNIYVEDLDDDSETVSYTLYDGTATIDFAWDDASGQGSSVPEPTTTTLSLLGLGALLMRRKRK